MARRQVENVLWLCTTPDALELPVSVAGSVKELAQMLGVSDETIYSAIWRTAKRGGKSKPPKAYNRNGLVPKG